MVFGRSLPIAGEALERPFDGHALLRVQIEGVVAGTRT